MKMMAVSDCMFMCFYVCLFLKTLFTYILEMNFFFKCLIESTKVGFRYQILQIDIAIDECCI